MTDQDLIIRLRQMIDYPAGIPSEAVRELVDICEAEIAIAYEWATGPPKDARGDAMAVQARSHLARSILRVIAKGYSIDWTKSI